MAQHFKRNAFDIGKTLVKRSLQSEKRRNIMIILAISLSAFIMSMCGIGIFSSVQTKKNLSRDTFQAAYYNLSEQDIEKLRSHPEIERAAALYSFGQWKNENGDNFSLSYMDDAALYVARKQFRLIEGTVPKAENEIAVSEEYLKKYAPDCSVGSKLSITVDRKQIDFVVSGILSIFNPSKSNYFFLASREFVKSSPNYNPAKYQSFVYFKNGDSMQKEDLQALASSIGKDYGFEFQYSFLYLNSKRKQSFLDFLPFITLALIVLLAGIIVIQSIFRISVNEKIRYYGQLRTLGATKEQIKWIVRGESRKLAFLGIPIGIVLGDAAGGMIGSSKIANGFHLSGFVVISMAVAAICWCMVRISIRKPMKAASGISPMEAVRFSSYQETCQKEKRVYHKINPRSLAFMNLGRDRKKTVSTLFSLTLGGLLLLVSASLFVSYSAEAQVKAMFFSNGGHFRIYLNDYQIDVTEQIRRGNPLNGQLKQKIQSIEGVKDVLTVRNTVGEASFTSSSISNDGILCDIISDDASEGSSSFLKTYLVAGQMPQSDLEVLFSDAYDTIKVGDKIKLTVNERTVPVVISGLYDGTYVGSSNGNAADDNSYILITKGLAEELVPGTGEYSYVWEIITESPEDETILGELTSYCSAAPSGISICSFSDEVDYFKTQMYLMFGGLQLLSWMIFLFGIVNLINMTLSNQNSRKQEISVMRSVGLTLRQVYQMLLIEGIYYIVISVVIMLAIGVPVGIVLCSYMGTLLGLGTMPYQFPVVQVGAYLLVLFIIQVILTAWAVKNMNKQSLVEQIKRIN